eukprot:scaffold21217_cov66-Skeletonema_marinoi.AAC.1
MKSIRSLLMKTLQRSDGRMTIDRIQILDHACVDGVKRERGRQKPQGDSGILNKPPQTPKG